MSISIELLSEPVNTPGGTINESSPNFVGFDGKWAKFPGSNDAHIHWDNELRLSGETAITVGVRIRKYVASATFGSLIGRVDVTGTEGFLMSLSATTNIVFGISVSGTYRYANVSVGTIDRGEHSIVGTWTSGGNIKMYWDGIYAGQSGATYSGDLVTSTSKKLTMGKHPDSSATPLECEVADPIVDVGRSWSAQEILDWHNRSTLR